MAKSRKKAKVLAPIQRQRRKATGLAEAYAKVREALRQEPNGLRFDTLVRRTRIPRQELARHLRSLRDACNLIEFDRASKRWILRGLFGIGGRMRPLQESTE